MGLLAVALLVLLLGLFGPKYPLLTQKLNRLRNKTIATPCCWRGYGLVSIFVAFKCLCKINQPARPVVRSLLSKL